MEGTAIPDASFFVILRTQSINKIQIDQEAKVMLEMLQDEGFSPKSGSPSIDDDRRAHHNELERRRRDHIKDHFIALKNSIPLLEGEKVSIFTVITTRQSTHYRIKIDETLSRRSSPRGFHMRVLLFSLACLRTKAQFASSLESFFLLK